MFCQNCGKNLPEGAAFCTECGAKVAESVTAEAATKIEPPKIETEKAESIAPDVAVTTAAVQSACQAIKKEETWKEKYFSFKGRLNRKRFILRSIVISIINAILAAVLCRHLGDSAILAVFVAISFVGFVAGLSLNVRRLHDLNHSGFFCLLLLIPFSFFIIIDFFLLIYLIFFKGTEGDNQYGPDPLAR